MSGVVVRVEVHAVLRQEHVGREPGEALVAVDERVIARERVQQRGGFLEQAGAGLLPEAARTGPMNGGLQQPDVADLDRTADRGTRHIAVGRAGVIVIDAKRYRGRIAVERRGGLLRKRSEHLLVGGRDWTKPVDGVLAQADTVRGVLAESPHASVPVRAVLCFVDGDWPLLGRLEIRGVSVLLFS